MESGAKILIELAKERHRNKDVKFKPSKPPPENAERRRMVKFSPQDFDRCVKSEDELLATLGRKWRSNIVKLGQFASYCKRKAVKEQVTIANGSQIDVPMLSIACTNVVLATTPTDTPTTKPSANSSAQHAATAKSPSRDTSGTKTARKQSS